MGDGAESMRMRTFLAATLCTLAACGLVEPELSPATPGPVGVAGELARPRVAENAPDRPRYIRDEWQPHLSDASPQLALITSTSRR